MPQPYMGKGSCGCSAAMSKPLYASQCCTLAAPQPAQPCCNPAPFSCGGGGCGGCAPRGHAYGPAAKGNYQFLRFAYGQ